MVKYGHFSLLCLHFAHLYHYVSPWWHRPCQNGNRFYLLNTWWLLSLSHAIMIHWFVLHLSLIFAGNDVSILGICSIRGQWECSGWSVPIHFGRWWRRGRGFGQHDYHHGHFLFSRFHPFSQRPFQEKLKILSIFCWFKMLILIDALIKSSFCFRMMIGCVLRDKMLRFDLRSFRTHLPEWSIIDWHERKKKGFFSGIW